jgi:membrane associated rhomboid family serine protease
MSANLRTWGLGRWMGLFLCGITITWLLLHSPVTHGWLEATLGRIQFDNAPVTLAVVLLSLAVEWAKHNIHGVRGAVQATALFSTPARLELATLFDPPNVRYVDCWRLPKSRVVRVLLFFVRTFLANIGHAGWGHFSNNATQLLLLGPACEGAFGSREVLTMIGIKSLVSVGTQWCFAQRNTTTTGASGIVFMLYLLSAQVNRTKGKVPLTLLLQMAIYLPKELEPILRPKPGDTVSHLGQ